jgi:hypothetical protein
MEAEEALKRARVTGAKQLVEVALTALSKIKVMNLEPQERTDVRTAHDLLEHVADGLAPRADQPTLG